MSSDVPPAGPWMSLREGRGTQHAENEGLRVREKLGALSDGEDIGM